METETFKIINIDDAIRMMEEIYNAPTLKVSGDYVWWLKLTNKKEYKILDSKISRRRNSFDTFYLVPNDDGKSVWVASEFVIVV